VRVTARACALARLIVLLLIPACLVAAIASRSSGLALNAGLIAGLLAFARWAARDATRLGYEGYKAEGWVLILGYIGPLWWLVRRAQIHP
jgi:hypothetical protein